MSDEKYGQIKPFDALNSRGLAGKREYVRGLEQRRDEEALSLLVECLCDESWFLRDLAEESLLRMGSKGAEILVPLLEQGLWYTRASAARVLGHCAHRPAVPGLLRLTEDPNETVAQAARAALAEIGTHGGAITLARSLYRLPPETRYRRFGEIRVLDRPLAERVDKMMRQEELMAAEDEDLTDESPMVRATEEGLEWEVLTGSSSDDPRPPRPEAPRGESTDA
jgi:hypothetical protein